MAGDWIKMRGNLWDDPRVSRLCDLCDAGEAAIVGALYWLWATADQHTADGCLRGLSLAGIDRKTGVRGFGSALVTIGWLVEADDGVEVPRFDEHNGASAKRRAADAQRKANVRSVSALDADTERTDSGQHAPDCGAREREDKREETPPTPSPGGEEGASQSPERAAADVPAATTSQASGKRRKAATAGSDLGAGFGRWWAAYPRRASKGDAEKAWRTLAPDEALVDRIVAATVAAARRDRWREQGGRFVPYPATWLRARGWEDDDLQPAAAVNGSAGGGWWFAQGYGSREAAVAAGAAP